MRGHALRRGCRGASRIELTRSPPLASQQAEPIQSSPTGGPLAMLDSREFRERLIADVALVRGAAAALQRQASRRLLTLSR